jgi:hypothetical protein
LDDSVISSPLFIAHHPTPVKHLKLRPTIAEIKSQSLDNLKATMNDPANWESLFARFDHEKALSGYIATYPH